MRFPTQIKTEHSSKDYVKGLASPIPYVIRVPSGGWAPYYSSLVEQRYGAWDTDCCWDYSGAAIVEAQLNYLKREGQMTPETITWFQTNGYIDTSGNFKISRRYSAILSGVEDTGNDPWNFCVITDNNGILPLSDLDYTTEQAALMTTQEAFDADYFNPDAITPAMRQKALKARTMINFQYEYLNRLATPAVPRQDLNAALLQSPQLVSIPVPQPESLWNTPIVAAQQGNTLLRHCVGIVGTNADLTYPIHDNYNPEWKALSADYYIGEAINIVITPVTSAAPVQVPQPWYNIIWTNVLNWLNNN